MYHYFVDCNTCKHIENNKERLHQLVRRKSYAELLEIKIEKKMQTLTICDMNHSSMCHVIFFLNFMHHAKHHV